ncbi:hypothetical protein C8J56DRAFT_970024 [Mycena floridula]|nr:hypothetical protein C8J56DRAFT_970024 [Mycena floridula]
MFPPRLDVSSSSTPFVAPSTWRNPSIITEPARRISLAQAAIEKSISMLDQSTGQIIGGAFDITATLYSQMATFDGLTNQTIYRGQLKTLFNSVDTLLPNFSDSQVYRALLYGYAAATAYAVYKDPAFLEWAQQSWQFGLNYTVLQHQLDGSQKSPRNITLMATCAGITMAGGSFANTDLNDPGINVLSTGFAFINSALLAESTSNATYLTAAQTAATFIHSHLLNVQNIVLDSISAQQSDKCGITNSNLFGYNQGLLVEGLAILSSLNASDVDTQNLLYSVIPPAVTYPDWHTDEGIVALFGSKLGDDRMIRGPIAAYIRNPANKDLRSYLRDYIGVQYNALLDLATTGNDIYKDSWLGPPPTEYSPGGQSNAISVLLAGISLQNDTSPSRTSGDTPSSPPTPVRHKSLAGPIGGSIVGALVLVAVILGVIFFLRRRKRREPPPRNVIYEYITEPAPSPLSTQYELSERSSNTPGLSRPAEEGITALTRRLASFGSQEKSDSPKGLTIMTWENPSITFESPVSAAEPNHSRLPDQVLFQLVAERLQAQQWEGQAPPDYEAESPGAGPSSIQADRGAGG